MKHKVEPGIYFDMPEDVYHSAEGLSCSGMKQLSVSPLHYWHQNFNPDFERPEESYPQRFGKAVHCRLLEPERFPHCYGAELCQDDLEGVLVTADDLKGFLSDNGLPTAYKRKQELIDRIIASGLDCVIWDVEQARHAEATEGKILLKRAETRIIEKLASVVLGDPYAASAFSGGRAEVSFFVRAPSGILLKARMDYVKPKATIDLKTFTNSRGKSTDKAVFDAIYYESYYLQSTFYGEVRELARQGLAAGELATHGLVDEAWIKAFAETQNPGFGFVFIESVEPFDLRIVQLKRSEFPGGDSNVYWSAAIMRIEEMASLYAECLDKYGTNRWSEPRPPYVLLDTDMPQLMFA